MNSKKFQEGYNDFIEIWARSGSLPSPLECRARHMESGPDKSDYLAGWLKAKKEVLN